MFAKWDNILYIRIYMVCARARSQFAGKGYVVCAKANLIVIIVRMRYSAEFFSCFIMFILVVWVYYVHKGRYRYTTYIIYLMYVYVRYIWCRKELLKSSDGMGTICEFVLKYICMCVCECAYLFLSKFRGYINSLRCYLLVSARKLPC